ncbi:MAG: CgeB family protein [Caulobacteraceae bacterium]
MKLVVFGQTVSSAWDNTHALPWRGLIAALERRGHDVVFFERDDPRFAAHRDLADLGEADLVLYSDWADVRVKAMAHLLDADAAMVTSHCPDALAASALVHEHAHVGVFYDLDAPVTLARLARGEAVDYLPGDGLGGFDLVLSTAGGDALTQFKQKLGARRAAPLYAHVDPDLFWTMASDVRYACDLSYLPACATDGGTEFQDLFVRPAELRPDMRFLLGEIGDLAAPSMRANIARASLNADARPAVYSSSRSTLILSSDEAAALGWSPPQSLLEAAACGAPILSNAWPGLEHFFTPDRELLVVSTPEQVVTALDRSPDDLRAIGQAARERVLDEHTSDHRAGQLLDMLADLVEGVLPADVPHADAKTLATA